MWLSMTAVSFFCCFSFLFSPTFPRSRTCQRLRPAADVKEKEKVPDGLHEPPDLRVGEEVPVPEVPLTGGPGPDRAAARSL